MKTVYFSHPFTGHEEENKKRARNYCKELSMAFPNVLFINPLDSFQYMDTGIWTYDQVMKKCLKLMLMCDAVLMAPEWEASRGCHIEYMTAKDKLKVFQDTGELAKWIKAEQNK